MSDRLRGRVAYVFGDHFDVDSIIGAARMQDRRTHDIEYLRTWVMHDFDPAFVEKVAPGDMLVAGQLFGYGHPHGQAMRIMRELGIRVVIAESFFPAFQHGERAQGMILLACPGIACVAQRGDAIELDWREPAVHLPARGIRLQPRALSPHEIACIEAGGEAAWLSRQPPA